MSKKSDKNKKDKPVNRKSTVVWTGNAVAVVLALALILFFAAKGGSGGKPAGSGSAPADETELSGSAEGTVVYNDEGEKVLVDDKGDVLEVLDKDPISTIRQTGNSNLSGVKTDTGSGTGGNTGADSGETPRTPWTQLSDDDYKITIRTLAAGYDGAFLEDGSDDEVKNVLALQIVNNSDKDIQYAEYAFAAGKTPISFKVTDLPAGQSCVVLESTRHQYDKSEVLDLISRVVAQVDSLPSTDKVLPVLNDDNSITLMNLTQEELPVVRVFYKYFYPDENTFVGGITYTATAEKIPAGGSVTISPSHYETNASIIMGTGVYDN